MTQNEEIYELLKKRPINSFERFNGGLYAGQLPRCIWDLENREPWKLKGKITHKDEKNGSTTYILNNQLIVSIHKPTYSENDYIFTSDGRAIPKETRQEVLFNG